MSNYPDQPVAVVTGGTTGIGYASAKRLLAAGHKVAVFSQNNEHVVAAAERLGEEFSPSRVMVRCVDLADPSAIATFFSEIAVLWGAPDILVCNAGYSPKGPNGRRKFDDIPLKEWDDVLNVNLRGAMLCCQAAAPEMAARGFGRIIFISSIAARTVPRIAGTSYVVSKAAISGLARSLMAEYAPSGVTVNTIAPGRVLSEMTGPADSSANQSALTRIPAGRLGTPDDIAGVVLFLASPEAGFINGAIIDVNGGEFAPV